MPLAPVPSLLRTALMLGVLSGLPISCAQSGDGLYSGGVQPSPSSRVNPFESGIPNDGGHAR